MVPEWRSHEVERLERIYSLPAIVEQRRQTLAALAVKPGERGLDVGCGPGFLTCELAREASINGSVAGLDPSREMLGAARVKAGKTGVAGRVDLVMGSAERLPFVTQSLDFVVVVQVYLYVAEVEVALREAARVLRPDGRLAIVDTDWESCVWLTSDDGRHRRVLDARVSQFAQPNLARRLPGLVRRAGLDLAEVIAIPITELRASDDSFSIDMIGPARSAALASGIPVAEVDAWERDIRERAEGGDYFFSVNRYLFLATKP